jgi:hypothetical protein
VKRFLLSVAIGSALAAGAAPSAVAATAASAPAPHMILTLPKQVGAGEPVSARGTVRGFEDEGVVVLRRRQGTSWKRLASGKLSQGRFRVGFSAPLAPGPVAVDASLTAGGRTLAVSPTLRLRVAAGSPIPTPVPPAPVPPPVAPPVVVPPEEEPPTEEPAPPSPHNSYWGAWIGPQFTGQAAPGDMKAVTDFEALAGKPLSLLETFSSFANCDQSGCDHFVPFPRGELESIRKYGAIPLFTWASEASSGVLEQPEFQLSDVAAGDYDSYIREWATAAREWGHPFFLRFDWEMNGDWYPWDESLEDNSAGDYVAAWRHVHDIFAEVGATNAAWTWCPYIDPNGKLTDLHELYPGDSYVDWTCLDGYNHGTKTNPSGRFRSFSELFGPSYREITSEIAPSKPMLIAEVASTEAGGSKPEWIEDMFEALPSEFPDVRGLMWFDYEYEGNDWAIETSTAATEAFADGVAEPRFLGNTLAGATAPISPP